MAAANVLAQHWEGELRKFETNLSEDEALLTAARGGNLPGVDAERDQRRRVSRGDESGPSLRRRAMKAYVEWLGEDDDTEEEEVGTASGFVDQD